MASWYAGTFKLVTNHLYDRYLVALGVSRTMVDKLSCEEPTVHIAKEDDEWTITTSTTFNTTEIKFKLGQEFDETTVEDRSCKSVITEGEDEDTLVHIQNYGDGLTSKIIYQFRDDDVQMVLQVPGKEVAWRLFERQKK